MDMDISQASTADLLSLVKTIISELNTRDDAIFMGRKAELKTRAKLRRERFASNLSQDDYDDMCIVLSEEEKFSSEKFDYDHENEEGEALPVKIRTLEEEDQLRAELDKELELMRMGYQDFNPLENPGPLKLGWLPEKWILEGGNWRPALALDLLEDIISLSLDS